MRAQFDDRGREIPDPTPLAASHPYQVRPESLQSMMQRMIREHLSRHAVDNGEESFEEANDFDLEDEDFDDPLTKYEEMGVENDESETGHAVPLNAGQAEPAGLRPGQPLVAGGPPVAGTSAVGREPMQSQGDALRPPVGESPSGAVSGPTAAK